LSQNLPLGSRQAHHTTQHRLVLVEGQGIEAPSYEPLARTKGLPSYTFTHGSRTWARRWDDSP